MRVLLIFCSGLLFVNNFSHATDFKFRAREHFEIHKLTAGGQDYNYRGLSNTINAWFEKPYEYAFGLSFSPILAGIRGDEDSPVGRNITLYAIGFEGKYFPKLILENIFLRGGLGYAHLRTGGIGKKDGFHFYTGLGYEIPFKSFGLALEVAQRFVELNDDVSISVFTPSIGVHFYKMF